MSLLLEETTADAITEPMAVVSPVERHAYESALLWALLGCLATLFGVLMATYRYYTKRKNRPRAKRERKRRLEQEKRRQEQQRIRNIPTDPVLVEHFFSTLNKKIKNGELEIEYKALNGHMQSRRCSRVAGVKICDNKLLHPLFNAVPYEHSRVNLKNADDEEGGSGVSYNASWINGFNRPKAFIAAQGPTTSSVNTFWLLIWQERISCVVMVTNLFEHSKEQCCKYWDSAVRWYGDVEVRLDRTHNTADCTIRTLIIRKRGCEDHRVVRQFAINSWSYHHCPNVTTVLEFRRRVRAYMSRSSGPVLVHCGLGTGRTGTYIAIDGLLDRVERDGTVNVYSYVNQMRKCRCGLVESKDQYEFIYKCLAMYIQCGSTVLKSHWLQDQLDLMACKDPRLRMNAFERQFKILHHIVRPLTVGECAAGHRKENRHKSRNILIQPPERARPYLLTHDNNKSTDFINAVYVDGYRSLNAYIATEWPLSDTMNDIWRMVLDCDVTSIVLLDDPGSSTMYPQFWPCSVGLPVRYGPIVVELQWTGVSGNVKSWLFHIRKRITSLFAGDTPRRSSDNRVVRMFQTHTWQSSQAVPANSTVFIELLTHLNKWREELAQTSPICIISKTGVERVGMFCAIHTAKDQLDDDDEVDIFRAVKIIRRNRPQLVCNMTEFIYCYSFMSMLLAYQKSQLNPNIPQIVISCPDEEQESQSLFASQTLAQAGLSNLKNSLLYGSGTSDAFMDRYSFSDVSSIISIEALDLNEDSQKAWLGLELDGAKYFLPARPSLPKEDTETLFDRLEYLNSLKALRETPPPVPRRGRRASEPAVCYSQLKKRRVSDTPRRPSVSWKQELLSYSKPPKLIMTPTLARLAASQEELPQVEVTEPPEPSSDRPSPVKQCNTNGVLATSALLTRNGGNLLSPNGLFKLSGSSLNSRSSKSSDGSQVYHTPSGSPLLFDHLDNDLRQTLKWISADSVFNLE